MCGICGEIRFKGKPTSLPSLQSMLDQIHRRGPDAVGVGAQNNIALGHRRLSILDLSPLSQQPMLDAQLGLGIVFNGCIYNFRELRAELIQKGYRFFSEGDTEVILKAYAEWGPRCVEKLTGMFAFAVWERDSGRLVLARDRLGIKPLYYAQTDGGLRFASTLPALLAGRGIDTSIDPIALHHYMSWHAVVPAPLTILKGVRKLPPASIMVIEPDGTERLDTYWSFSVGAGETNPHVKDTDWTDLVLERLTHAVKRRMIADVPVGVLLSGGLDSSLLVALLAQEGQQDLKTFSIGFEAVDQEAGDEFVYSDYIARHFRTDHTKILVDPSETLDALPETISAMSEPMMSHDAVGFFLLSREVSKHVKVVQSGQGADEVFAGYHWYQRLAQSNDVAADYARLYFDRDHAEMQEAVNPAFICDDYSRDFVERFFASCNGHAPIDKALQIDSQIMLVDDPVKRVDNMTMAWGIEGRVPFLDHELVELAARIPAALKLRDGGKHVLKEAARRVLPDLVIDRPKGYFPVPALKRVRGPFLDYARDILTSRCARERGIFVPDYVRELLETPETSLTPKGHSKLWQVTVLEQWLQAHLH